MFVILLATLIVVAHDADTLPTIVQPIFVSMGADKIAFRQLPHHHLQDGAARQGLFISE